MTIDNMKNNFDVFMKSGIHKMLKLKKKIETTKLVPHKGFQKLTAAVIVIWQGKIFMVHFPMSPRTDAHFATVCLAL